MLDAEEEKLTNGLVKVTAGRQARRLRGARATARPRSRNTERPGFSEAKSAMEKSNYDVKPLVLARERQGAGRRRGRHSPGPRNDLFPPELEALDAYVGRGGKVLAMVNPLPERGASRSSLVKYGFQLDDDLVIETNPIGRLFGIGPEVPIIQQYESHPITRDMGGVTTLFPLTRSVAALKTPPKGVNVQSLARTSPESWGRNQPRGPRARRGEARSPGPQGPARRRCSRDDRTKPALSCTARRTLPPTSS